MRLFTAVDIPEEVKSALGRTIERFRPMAKLKWTDAEKLHITTKFIGEWPEARMEELTDVLNGVGSPGVLNIQIRGLRWVPEARRPRMLWAGVESGPELGSLAHETEQAVHALGVAVEDRKYSPHLTLARIRDRVPLDTLHRAIEAEGSADFGSFAAPAFYLYLSKDGRYTKLAEFSLV
jgi:2'-5' RNA ligase